MYDSSWSEVRLGLEKRKMELEFELEMKKQEIEMAKVKLEERKLVKSDEIKTKIPFNITKSISLIPEFSEADPEGSFNTFEKRAIHFNCRRSEWSYLLQAKLTGRAAVVFSNSECTESYEDVQQSILTAFSVTLTGTDKSLDLPPCHRKLHMLSL